MYFEQLPLDIAMDPAPTLENFIPGDNGAALACLAAMLERSFPQFVYLWGETGVGKTHLAQAMGLMDAGVPVFCEERMRYAVDDVDTLNAEGLDALFSLINEIRLHPEATLVMTGKKSPAEKFVRPDICTRLTWGAVFHIRSFRGDASEVLLAQAQARDIVVTPEARQWIENYLPRDVAALSHLIAQMDRELLAQKKNTVTVPLLKKWSEKQSFW